MIQPTSAANMSKLPSALMVNHFLFEQPNDVVATKRTMHTREAFDETHVSGEWVVGFDWFACLCKYAIALLAKN